MGDLFAVLDGAAANAAPFVVVEVPILPRGKGRPRSRIAYSKSRKPFVHVYTDADTVKYEEAIAWHAKAAMKGREPVFGPLAMRLFAIMPVPKSWPKRDRDAALAGTIFPEGKPDWDNIGKSASDAMNGIVFADDKQLVRTLVVKEYGESPGLIIEIYKLP